MPDPELQAFNPYGLHAIRIPLGMISDPDISWAAKCLYGRLALHRGRKSEGRCNPGLAALSKEMAASVDTIDRWIGELTRAGYLRRKRLGPNKTAECEFLRHPRLVADSATLRNQDAPVDSAEMPNQDAADSADLPDRFRNSAVLIPQPCGVTYKEENVQENIQENTTSSSSAKFGNDDEGIPDKDLIEQTRIALRLARAKSAGAEVLDVILPDTKIVSDILSEFVVGNTATLEELADIRAWLKSTEKRRLGRKSKSATWGLFLADACTQAPSIRAARERVDDEPF